MDRDALRYALLMLARFAGLSAAGAFALTAAIWLPTLALQRLAGWRFLDAYMMGVPTGIIILCSAYIGVVSYRRKARRAAALSDLARMDGETL